MGGKGGVLGQHTNVCHGAQLSWETPGGHRWRHQRLHGCHHPHGHGALPSGLGGLPFSEGQGRRHRVDTFLVNEPVLPWSLREGVWARGMAHTQVVGSDHLPVLLFELYSHFDVRTGTQPSIRVMRIDKCAWLSLALCEGCSHGGTSDLTLSWMGTVIEN